jgi:hypothetical protein
VDAKRYDEAIGLLRGYPERYPKSKHIPEALYLQGYARITAGERNEGIADLRAFVAKYPQHDLANQARRTVVERLLKDGRKDELAEEYKLLMHRSAHGGEPLRRRLHRTRLNRPKDSEPRGLRCAKTSPTIRSLRAPHSTSPRGLWPRELQGRGEPRASRGQER